MQDVQAKNGQAEIKSLVIVCAKILMLPGGLAVIICLCGQRKWKDLLW